MRTASGKKSGALGLAVTNSYYKYHWIWGGEGGALSGGGNGMGRKVGWGRIWGGEGGLAFKNGRWAHKGPLPTYKVAFDSLISKTGFPRKSTESMCIQMLSAVFDGNLIDRGSVYDHFLQSPLAWEAVWDRLFRKEFGN